MSLVIDFETRSHVDLLKHGAYIYAQHPSTDILCMSWAIGDMPIELWKPSDGNLPRELRDYLKKNPNHAWNSQFERLMWEYVARPKYGFPDLPLERFICIAALARARGFPGKLDNAARFLAGAYQKDMEGHRVMLRLCKPRDDGTWNEDPEDLQRLYDYCKQDTAVERMFLNLFLPFSPAELDSFWRTERLNDRGIHCDRKLAIRVVEAVAESNFEAQNDLSRITQGAVTAPTEVARIRAWCAAQGWELPDLNKSTIQHFLEDEDPPDDVRTVLEIRLDNAKASVSKFSAMVDRSSAAGIIRGLYLWRGAGQTGRYASMGVQIHNLVKESAPELIPVFLRRGMKGLSLLGPPVKLLSKMVRPAFVAAPGMKLSIGDFAQIEARIVAWLAGEEWLLEAFRSGRSAYCEFGGVVYERTITKAEDALEYAASKACVLGLGFGGGPGALDRSMRAINMPLPGETLEHLVDTYRSTIPAIKAYWRALTNAVLAAMYSPGKPVPCGRVSYLFDEQHLWCKLPSGRVMCYPFAEIVISEKFDRPMEVVRYRRGNRRPKAGVAEWPTVDLWYGILIENLAQGIALDLLDAAQERLEADGRFILRGHVHDEIITEVPEAHAEIQHRVMLNIMKVPPKWADGLPIDAEGFVSARYGKG